MSKLSFRARALDTTKPMPVLRAEDVPDLPDFAAINRAVPQMPTGMEKEEESEHHLQRAISAQQAFGRAVDHVIPTPEVFHINDKEYDQLYPANFKPSRAYIHVQLQAFEQDQPEYDMDSEDEDWFGSNKQHLAINETRFEQMLECLEKNSGLQKVIDLSEARPLLRDEEKVVISVYDYWLNKKLKVGKSLLPTIKTEKRDGSSGNNPYIAFRRRTEKMQTRKNRKNDETSYEKMLKLKRDFSAVRELMGLVKSRETLKLDELKSAFDIIEKRYTMGDYAGQIYNEISNAITRSKEQAIIASNQARDKMSRISKDENAQSRRKRDYKKRPKHEVTVPQKALHGAGGYGSTDDEHANDVVYQGGQINLPEEIEDNPDGQFAFKRKKGCNYHAPLVDRLSGWPWESPEEGGLGMQHFRFNYTSLSRPRNFFLGLARRRIGRGGRIIFDRAHTVLNEEMNPSGLTSSNNDNEWLHYRPVSPPSYDVDESSRRIFQFNSEAFSDIDMEDSENEEPVGRLKGSTQPESHLYKYHEAQFSNSVVCNSQHSSSKTPTISPSSSSSLTASKPASQPKEVNVYLVSNNGSYSEYINDDLNESDPRCILNDDLIIEQPTDLMNCDPRVSKLDSSNRTRSTSDGAPLGNNVPINNGGSDYLHLDGTEHCPLQPSSTSVNETDSSASNSVAPLDSKAGIVSSSANATLNSTPNTFSTSHYKSMKLTNNRSLHPTDVT